MKIHNYTNQSFTRAFTTQELQSYDRLLRDSRKALGLKDTEAIIFDFNIPSSEGENIGIGTTWSNNAIGFVKFLKRMLGITSIQLGPQGRITIDNFSPYSGTNFAFGSHIIDLKSLEEDGLLPLGYCKQIDKKYIGNRNIREYKTDYRFVLFNQEIALRKVYSLFKKLKSKNTLKREFEDFKTENPWLEKESIYRALANNYKTENLDLWSEVDRELYNQEYPCNLRQARIAQIKSDLADEIEFQEMVQFLAARQQKQARARYNQLGIKIYGDRLIGFSQSEKWANESCFLNNEFYGAYENSWGVCAPDYNKIGECDGYDKSKLKETGKLLYDVFCQYFKRYDGIRIDAAFQLVTPIIYNANGERQDKEVLGKTLLNILKLAAHDTLGDKFDENMVDNIMMEFCRMLPQDIKESTKNQFSELFETLWRRNPKSVKAYKNSGNDENSMCIGLGSHDSDTLVSRSRNEEFRERHLGILHSDYGCGFNEQNLEFKNQEYKNQNGWSKREEDFRTAKFAEIFTTKKHFFTLPDVFGMEERINVGNQVNSTNWKIRIPTNYEEFYYSQLSKGYGLNLPKVLANALRMKSISNQGLIKKLEEAAEILRIKGPNTTRDADKINAGLGKIFTYSC